MSLGTNNGLAWGGCQALPTEGAGWGKIVRYCRQGVGEVAQWLRPLTALKGDVGSISRTYMAANCL